MKQKQFDFAVTNQGTVWTIQALSEEAKQFAEDNFSVEDWMGEPTRFTTDWRPARDIVRALDAEGFTIKAL